MDHSKEDRYSFPLSGSWICFRAFFSNSRYVDSVNNRTRKYGKMVKVFVLGAWEHYKSFFLLFYNQIFRLVYGKMEENYRKPWDHWNEGWKDSCNMMEFSFISYGFSTTKQNLRVFSRKLSVLEKMRSCWRLLPQECLLKNSGFCFTGFLNYQKAFNYLQQAIS